MQNQRHESVEDSGFNSCDIRAAARPDKSIDLVKAWESQFTEAEISYFESGPESVIYTDCKRFLRRIESRRLVRSRQIAALALAQADWLFAETTRPIMAQ